MIRGSAKLWIAGFAILLGIADVVGPSCLPVAAQQPNANQSWYTPITSGVKNGISKVGKAFDPKASKKPVASEDDAISLKAKSSASPDLYVAIGMRCEETNRLADAERQYQTALSMNRDHLGALLAYARLKEQTGFKEDALWLYQRAVKVHPKEPSVHNNIGLYYARQGRLDEAAEALTTAVRLAPKNPLYRNNLATVLVDQCRFREAFSNLREVHGEAAAYYNMGYLLNKKGQMQAAIQHFAQASRIDPSLVAARRWVEYLQKKTAQARLPDRPPTEELQITPEKNRWTEVPVERPREFPVERTRETPREPSRVDFSRTRDDDSRDRVDYTKDRDDFPRDRAEQSRDERAEAPREPRRHDSSAIGPDRNAASMMPDAVRPRRLPPVTRDESQDDGPSLPGFSCNRASRPASPDDAPMPPPSTNSAVRRLPEVR